MPFDGPNSRARLGQLTDTTQATPGQVPVVQDDGSYAFESVVQGGDSPSFATITSTSLTPSRLVASGAGKVLESVNLDSKVSGTTNRITASADGVGGVTLTTPQDTHTGASPTFVNVAVTSPGTNPSDLATRAYAQSSLHAVFSGRDRLCQRDLSRGSALRFRSSVTARSSILS